MLVSSRLALYFCTYLGTGLFWNGDRAIPAASTPASSRWELHLLDGQPVARHQRYLDNDLLPSLPAGTTTPLGAIPHVGVCLPSLGTQLAGTLHLILNMLEADNSTLDVGLRYLGLLNDIRTYEVSGNRLCLYDANCPAPRLVFVVAPPSQLP